MGKAGVVIGLVGQVCAGKSAVTAAFRDCEALTFDADRCVHDIYRHPEVVAEVRALLGSEVLDEHGVVNRAAVGKRVFGDAALLKRLVEQIIYPRTEAEIRKAIAAFRSSDAVALLLDAPTLFESGRDSWCEKIVYVEAPLERRREWARSRGWDEGELERREARLSNDELKRQRADEILRNDGTLDDLKVKARALLERWTH